MPDQSASPTRDSELIADPSRQATALFKGIDYQIWQTVLAWMSLDETDILIIEGAEDFDVVNGIEANTSQVKNLASP